MSLESMLKKMSVFAIALGIVLVLFATPAFAGGGAPLESKIEAVSGSVPVEAPAAPVTFRATITGPKFGYSGDTYRWFVNVTPSSYNCYISWYYGFSSGDYQYFAGNGNSIAILFPTGSNLYLRVTVVSPFYGVVEDRHTVYRTVANNPGPQDYVTK